jgi:hypothetical protein
LEAMIAGVLRPPCCEVKLPLHEQWSPVALEMCDVTCDVIGPQPLCSVDDGGDEPHCAASDGNNSHCAAGDDDDEPPCTEGDGSDEPSSSGEADTHEPSSVDRLSTRTLSSDNEPSGGPSEPVSSALTLL